MAETVVRDREIRTALVGTNQIVGFVTVPAWKKKYIIVHYNVSLLNFGVKDLVSYFIQTLRAK